MLSRSHTQQVPTYNGYVYTHMHASYYLDRVSYEHGSKYNLRYSFYVSSYIIFCASTSTLVFLSLLSAAAAGVLPTVRLSLASYTNTFRHVKLHRITIASAAFVSNQSQRSTSSHTQLELEHPNLPLLPTTKPPAPHQLTEYHQSGTGERHKTSST